MATSRLPCLQSPRKIKWPPYGLYQFVSLPLFGVTTTFQCLMDRIRPHATYADDHLDNIIIYSNTWAEHVQQVAVDLESLMQVGLTANPKKCAVGWMDKTAAIASCPHPHKQTKTSTTTKPNKKQKGFWSWFLLLLVGACAERVPQIWSSGWYSARWH